METPQALAEVEKFVNDPGQRGFGIGLLHVLKQGALDLPARLISFAPR